MAINKVMLAKQIDGTIEYLYPKTTADMVLYEDSSTLTVKNLIDNLQKDVYHKLDSPTNEMGDPVRGAPGQILSMDEDGNYPIWIDYIPNGLSTITIYADCWTYLDYSDRYQGQVVEVSNYNITPNSQVNIHPSSAQVDIFQDNNLSFITETRTTDGITNVIVFAIGSIPNEDYTMQVTVVEVD